MKLLRFAIVETFTTRLLGTVPADKEVYAEFIGKKKAEAEEKRRRYAQRHGSDATESVGTAIEELETINEDAGVTVFHNDLGQKTEDGGDGRGVFLFDYQVAGFYKEAAEILQDEHGVKQPRSKLDNFLCVRPRRVYILDSSGAVLTKTDDKLERPLRAMTMQGPRVSLACSEVVNPGRRIEYVLEFLPFIKVGTGCGAKYLDLDRFVEMLAAHGRMKGRGQWRNGGNGRFTTEVKALDL